MRAAVYQAPGRLAVLDVGEPEVRRSDDVVLELEAAGLCGTDLHIVSIPQLHPATPGIVLGHEFVGRVVAMGPAVTALGLGDRVVAGPNVWCDQCPPCRRGLRTMCERTETLGITRDGGFGRFVCAPARVLYPTPPDLSPEEALFAEPLSCVLNGFQRIGTSYGDRVVVLGAGPVGIYFVRLLRHFGAGHIIVSEPNPKRRREAVRSGASHVIDPSTEPRLSEIVCEITAGGADVAIDTTGSLLAVALSATRKAGKVLLFGLDMAAAATVRPFDVVRYEKTILGCFVDNEMIPRALELIPSLRLTELISHRVSLEGVHDGLAMLRAGDSIKVVIDLRQIPRGANT